MVIKIDFQGGAHGNFLEFACNKFLTKMDLPADPFNPSGASHNKKFDSSQIFRQGHFFLNESPWFLEPGRYVSIFVVEDDLLPLSQISLLRAGDYNIDNDLLEIDTFHKFNNRRYRWVLDNIIESFFKDQIQQSYSEIKDPSWPDISTVDDFIGLPDWIQKECIEVHNLILLELSEKQPHCPRHVLREFFKIGFKNPEISGFLTQQKKQVYPGNSDVFYWPYSVFYDCDEFVKWIKKLAEWSNFSLDDEIGLRTLHQKFLQRQPYIKSKNKCDQLITRICDRDLFDLPKLTLLEQSYVEARLEKYFNKDKLSSDGWFSNSQEIIDFYTRSENND